MKSIIHAEVRCGSCGSQMQYHEDVFVRCLTLKCEQRNKEYHAPTVDLKPVKEASKDAGRKAAKD